jgi:protein involved in polysaccharide export with SLBB domain
MRFIQRACGNARLTVLALVLLTIARGASAQSAEQLQRLQSLTPEQRQLLLDSLAGKASEISDSPKPVETKEPTKGAVSKRPDAPRSTQSAETPEDQLEPFGYDLFLGEFTTFAPVTEIPVPSDYALGPGDIVKVQLFGNENVTYNLTISRDGKINFPKLGPIEAAGLSFDAFRDLIERRVQNEMIGVRVNVSLGQLRSMRVFVVGDANRPGSYTVSSLSTITNALVVSGGISFSGSLRGIQLKRNGRTVRQLDLYDLLLNGDSGDDVRLQPGDVIFIPPVGKRVTVAGQVKRPAIYEIKVEATAGEVLDLAGGLRPSAAVATAQVERYENANRKILLQLDVSTEAGLAVEIQDGDILRLPAIPKRAENRVDIAGYVRFPGKYQWREGQQLADLLRAAQPLSSNAEQELYTTLALIERTAPESGLRGWHPIDLRAVLNGQQAEPLLPNDLVLIFTRKDIEFISSRSVRRILLGQVEAEERRTTRVAEVEKGTDKEKEADVEEADVEEASVTERTAKEVKAPGGAECPPLAELAKILSSQRTDRFAAMMALLQSDVGLELQEATVCSEIFTEAPSALPYLLEHAVAVVGEVRRPGLYPVSAATTVSKVLELSGGLTPDSDAANIERVSYAAAAESGGAGYQTVNLASAVAADGLIQAGDVLRVKARYLGQEAGTVEVRGEFRLPGRYNIIKGETLSQLIARVGGITDSAYPYGAVFTRESARRAEEQSFRRAADELQNALVTAVTSGAIRNDAASAMPAISGIIQQLRTEKAVGRVVIEADPRKLQERPELDIPLEPGDKIFIPKRPTTVTVIGQVLNPGTLGYDPGHDVAEYIELAGSYSQASDEDRIFLVLPNGSARPISTGFWNRLTVDIPPGSAIVVPRDATPFNSLVLTERIVTIFRDLAISAAAIVTITGR